jgi:tryptophan 6-halogenase
VTEGADLAHSPATRPAISVREVQRPRRVLIVGGGTAGWITAALLRRAAPAEVTISLIESSDIPTIGVGEATLPGIRTLLRYIGIDEAEFLLAADAIFKLGIRFRGWNPDRDYWHPFGAVTGPAVLVNDWLRKAAAGDDLPIDTTLGQGIWDIAAAGLAPQSARCPPYTGDVPVYAYHLDAGRLAQLLKVHAVAAGVRHVVDNVTRVGLRPDGWVSHVQTEGHGALHADLFFDCSGFRGLLINGALGEPFESFGRQLWCDRAVALNVPGEPASRGDLPPYTSSTTGEAGWIWQIPLFSRSGNGYVYSSAHVDPDRAEAELRAFLGADDSVQARHITIRTGKSRRVWVGNCIAVGLAGGFIEPLESTGIALIQDVGEFFVHFSPDLAWDDTFAAKLNGFMDASYDFIRDFVACHYITAARDDTPFWRDVRGDPAVHTPLIDEVLDLWDRGELHGIQHADGSRPAFRPYSWAYIIGGNGVRPKHAVAARVDPSELEQAREELNGKTRAIKAMAEFLPDNRERVRDLRQAWRRGERPQAAPDHDAYVRMPHQLVTGYLTDGQEVPWAPGRSRDPVDPSR